MTPRGARPAPDRQPRSEAVSVQARNHTIGLGNRLSAWLLGHLHTIVFSLGRLARAPLATLMTAGVIAISLALPAGLYVLLDNLRTVSGQWEQAAQVSLFLRQDLRLEQAQAFADEIRSLPEVDAVTLIPADQALEEFRRTSGFGDALNALNENPLPTVLSIQPRVGVGAARIKLLVETLGSRDAVELAQLDMEWLERLFAMMDIVLHAIAIIAVLLGLGVLLAVGNTIRLDIENRRDEIVVSKLIGATNAFIRRPFLYGGIWYGLLGGLVAWIVVSIGMGVIDDPVQQLTHLYQSGYQLRGLGFGGGMSLLLLGGALGWCGAWLAVGRHLRAIEPT
ncbi:MAG: cell division protein FtsX [Gammaproteobacteria bacterium]|nr:permease-like cell division protein FtsX [Gammaproteobacteria bacterium]MCP5136240.1 cell division protein FtsX [Gammaproteobacteria bacterium]